MTMQASARKIPVAVIDNGFGEIGIDARLGVQEDDEQWIEFTNDGKCGTVPGDWVETTRLADRAPLASYASVCEQVRAGSSLDSFASAVNATNLDNHLDQGVEAQEQMAFVDSVLINKMDLASDEEIARIKRSGRSLNRLAKIHCSSQDVVDLALMLVSNAVRPHANWQVGPEFPGNDEPAHDPETASFALRESHPIMGRFIGWDVPPPQEHGVRVLRTKGALTAHFFNERDGFQNMRIQTTMSRFNARQAHPPCKRECVATGRHLDQTAFAAAFVKCVAD
jgi:G3E family GTPase